MGPAGTIDTLVNRTLVGAGPVAVVSADACGHHTTPPDTANDLVINQKFVGGEKKVCRFRFEYFISINRKV